MEQGKRLKPERRLDKVSVVDAARGGVDIQGSGAKLPSWLCFVEFSDYFWVVRLPLSAHDNLHRDSGKPCFLDRSGCQSVPQRVSTAA